MVGRVGGKMGRVGSIMGSLLVYRNRHSFTFRGIFFHLSNSYFYNIYYDNLKVPRLCIVDIEGSDLNK